MNNGNKYEKKVTGYPSLDRPWLQYYSESAIREAVPEGSMYEYMHAQNEHYLFLNAISYYGRKITYGQLEENIVKCAKALVVMGIKKGDIVSLNMLSIPETVYLLYAVNRIGAICNFLVMSSTAEEIGKQIKSTNSKIVITIDIAAEKIKEALCGCDVRVVEVSMNRWMAFPLTIFGKNKRSKEGNWMDWKEFIAQGMTVSYMRYPRIGSGDTAVIAYTSGTTGESKGVLLSNQAANALAFGYLHADTIMDFQRGQTFLNVIPPFLSYGLFLAIHMPLCVGMELILSPDPSPARFAKKIMKYKPNHFSGGTLHISNISTERRTKKADLSFIITAAYGGDREDKEWEKNINSFLHEHGCKYGLINGYGLTEMASSFGTKGHHTEEMIPFVKNNIKVLDLDSGEELPYGKEGELCVSGPSMMTGYLGRRKATEELIWEENGVRWLHTGDVGYVSENGYFFVTGRIKRILWTVESNGMVSRVYPMKIEDVITGYKDVEKCAVVGIRNGEKGYCTKAFVVSQRKTEELKKEILELCHKQLPANSWPTAIEFIEELPRTAAGKVDFQKLEAETKENK